MRIDILTLFPEIALAPLSDSIIQRARGAGLVEIHGQLIETHFPDVRKMVQIVSGTNRENEDAMHTRAKLAVETAIEHGEAEGMKLLAQP